MCNLTKAMFQQMVNRNEGLEEVEMNRVVAKVEREDVLKYVAVENGISGKVDILDNVGRLYELVRDVAREEGLLTNEYFSYEVLEDVYGFSAKLDGRVTRYAGVFQFERRYDYKLPRHAINPRIIISRLYYDSMDMLGVLSTMLHELAHAVLFFGRDGEGFKDGDETFEHLLKQLGAYSTGTKVVDTLVHVYSCGCNKVIYKRHNRKMENGEYYCGECFETFKYDGRFRYSDLL